MESDEVIGTIALKYYGKSRGYLKWMYIKKEYRCTELSKVLLHNLVSFAKNNNYKEIFLGTNEFMVAANKFYQKNKFEKISLLPKDFPEFGDTIFYRLEL